MRIESQIQLQWVLFWSVHDTCFGRMATVETADGVIAACGFADDEQELSRWQREVRELWPESKLSEGGAVAGKVLEAWFDGEDPAATLQVRGNELQIHVWEALATIPMGEVLSYGQLAERVERFHAYRAVGQCVGRNRHALLVPCHRVMRADGGLGGYHWGEERKKRILEWERDRATGQPPE